MGEKKQAEAEVGVVGVGLIIPRLSYRRAGFMCQKIILPGDGSKHQETPKTRHCERGRKREKCKEIKI